MSSDEMIEQPEDSTGASLESPGELLRIAREKVGQTQADIADKLKVPESYVSAIEDSAFDRIPAELVFIRGYIRRYARQVSLSCDELVTTFDRYTGDNSENTPALKEGRPIEARRQVSPLVSWGGSLATILLVGAVSYYSWNSGQKSEALEAELLPDVQEMAGQETEERVYADELNVAIQEELAESAVDPDEPDTEQERIETPETLPEPAQEQASEANIEEIASDPVEAVSSGVRLVVRFVEDCWVQIKDMNGNSLYADIQKAGSELDMQVPAAVEVRFGNVPGVDNLNFDGRTVEVKPSSPGRKVASLVLGSVDAG